MNSDSQNSDSTSIEADNLAVQSPSLNNRTKVLILQHPQEKKEALATVPLLLKNLKNISLKIGLSWPNLKKLLDAEVDHSKWAVIYLGTQTESDEFLKSGKEVNLVGKTDSLKNLEGIVVLDGSWREVKTLWWRNAWLLKLNRIVLNPQKSSAYSVLRREPRKQSLSTVEAVAMVLGEIEKDPKIKEVFDFDLQKLIAENKSSVHKPKIDRRRRNFRRSAGKNTRRTAP